VKYSLTLPSPKERVLVFSFAERKNQKIRGLSSKSFSFGEGFRMRLVA
jgi:hypothetical protein